MFGCSGSGLCHGFGQPDCPALRNENAIDTGTLGGTEDRSKVSWVLDASQQKQQRVLPDPIENLVSVDIIRRRNERYNTLMICVAARDSIKLFARDAINEEIPFS